MNFLENLLLLAAVNEVSKSTRNWQSYSLGYGGSLFWLTVYTWGFYNTDDANKLRNKICHSRKEQTEKRWVIVPCSSCALTQA